MEKPSSALRELLAHQTGDAILVQPMEEGWVRCVACGHRCKIAPGREGICKVRFNANGILRVPRGYVAGIAVDPIEKKPFFHAHPGSQALSFGMLGCDYHCGYCQNWFTSQALRDPAAESSIQPISAEEIVDIAVRRRIPVLTSTYNEPLITTEWAVEIFRLAKRHEILCSYVSNGNGTREVIDYLRPYLDLCKIDLKSFRQKNYQQLGGTLDNVLATIHMVKEAGIWLEVVTLVVPGFNDSDDELRDIAGFLSSVSKDIPWHVTAFHPEYAMTDRGRTPTESLMRAAEHGRTAGLRFVYAGNIHGSGGNLENTYCPSCSELLIERSGFTVRSNRLRAGSCPRCQYSIPGLWG